jgi:hypothetical protein
MNARDAFRQIARVALVIALFALSATSTLAESDDPYAPPPADIIVIGG